MRLLRSVLWFPLLLSSCGELGPMRSTTDLDAPVRVEGIVTPLEFAAPQVAAPARIAHAAEPTQPEELGTGGAPDDEARDAEAEPTKPSLDPERVLMATSWQTFIYERPDFDSPKLGYLRSGTVVERATKPAGFGGCAKGFYRIEPRGYVCVGKAATLKSNADLAGIARQPRRELALPYLYAQSGPVPPELFSRVPPKEPDKQRNLARWGELRPGAPEFLAAGQPSLRSNGERMSPLTLVVERAVPRSSFALIDAFEVEGRGFGLATDLLLLPLERLEPVKSSVFHGVVLEGRGLPLAFVLDRAASLFSGEPARGLRRERRLEYREAVLLSGRSERLGGKLYLETSDGNWVVDGDSLVKLNPRNKAPAWAKPGRPWLDVSLTKQSLVAYVGMEPVYATLVSTGRDGLGDPATTHSTVQGEYLIHTKHVTNTLASEEEGDVFDHRDVPYVQFFKDGYALHAAHWHDDFGRPKSHGCINLAPEDARWLFEWSDPEVPQSWHGAMTLRDGTLVSIHP